MDDVPGTNVSLRRLGRGLVRLIFLVVVPTGCAFSAWYVPFARLDPEGLLLPSMVILGGILPLVGLVVVGLYAWSNRRLRLLLTPFWPFALMAVIFLIFMVDLGVTMPRDESQDAMIPIGQFFSGFAQAWLALGGGLVSFFRGRSERPTR